MSLNPYWLDAWLDTMLRNVPRPVIGPSGVRPNTGCKIAEVVGEDGNR